MKPPLFIIGTGRSGTTLLFNLLAQHPELAWPCPAMVVGKRHGRGLVPDPEPYAFWQRFYHGFASPCRDLTEHDVPNSLPIRLQAEFALQCEAMGKDRLLTKWTGWSRVRFMETCFPGAQYIHIVRDGRAVAWSLMQQPWWHGWQGPSQWRWGPLSEENRQIWDDSSRSFAVLAGLQWKICVENCSASSGFQPGPWNRLTEIRYEDLVAKPEQTLAALCKWIELEPHAFDIDIKPDKNNRWREEMPPEEQTRLEQAIEPLLRHYKYLP